MKCELVTFQSASNGIALCVVPETDVEFELLRGLWRHGKLEAGNHTPSDQKHGVGFYVQWRLAEADHRSND